jgi:putative hydrolase of the HAD superfamily
MIKNIEVVFFDLFYTLVALQESGNRKECDVLGITFEEWDKHTENLELYKKRATSRDMTPLDIIEAILDFMDITVDDDKKNEMVILREERFKRALVDVDTSILSVLKNLKQKGLRLCLISNADIIDVMHWDKSPLNSMFDEVIFSYETGSLKPEREIYELALKKMNVRPEQTIFVGDGGSNELEGAKAVGMNTVLTEYLLLRCSNTDNSVKEFADYCIKDFTELEHILLT